MEVNLDDVELLSQEVYQLYPTEIAGSSSRNESRAAQGMPKKLYLR